jgi:hypothetical protein
MTTYNAAIPQPSNLISNSQSQIFGNFDQLNNQFAIDHTAFNTGSGNGDGFHKKITFSNVLATPSPSNPVSVLYTKATGGAGTQQLYFKNAGQAEQQITGAPEIGAWAKFNGTTAGTNAPTQGYNVTSVQRTFAGTYVVNFTRSFTTATYMVQLTATNNTDPQTTQVFEIFNRGTSSVSFKTGGSDLADCNILVMGTLA